MEQNGKKPEGKVVEIIGHINDPGTDIMSIVKGYDLPVEFSQKIMKQVENVSNEVSAADMAGRMDLRDWQTVTIDGEDAKDLDDAITLTKEGDLYELGVHIADVSNYVQESSALDVEALKRGTSVYLVDRVIPMLPHKLSNGICSLNAGENRLALSCIMKIDEKGNVTDHTIAETVIKVDRRMSYTSVKKILEEHDVAEIEEYKELVPMFRADGEAGSDITCRTVMKRGSIDFDFAESKDSCLDEQGEPVEIKPYDRNVATKIIEDFMLHRQRDSGTGLLLAGTAVLVYGRTSHPDTGTDPAARRPLSPISATRSMNGIREESPSEGTAETIWPG